MRCALSTLFLLLVAIPSWAQGSVNVYNWSDYIAEDQLKDFAKDTGIKVNYTTYDSNEILDAKLRTGKSGYDIVVPTASPFFVRQLQANIFAALDKSKLKNWKNLDPEIMTALAKYDPNTPWRAVDVGHDGHRLQTSPKSRSAYRTRRSIRCA